MTGLIWINGVLSAETDKTIMASDRGFTLGDGVFETIAVFEGALLYLDRHLQRLQQGLNVLAIDCHYDFSAAIKSLVIANNLEQGSVRLTVSRGMAPRGLLPDTMLSPTLLITSAPYRTSSSAVTAITAQETRRNEQSPLSRIKSLNYGDQILAKLEAQKKGADEAILLNTQGHVASATAGNIFIIKDETITTPPLSEGALPGIMRGLMIEAGIAVEEPSDVAKLKNAEAVFITNSLGLTIISNLDGRDLLTDYPDLKLASYLWKTI